MAKASKPADDENPADEELIAYLDGELDPVNALAIKARIDSDPQLQAELAQAEALRAALQLHFPREPVPEAFRSRIAAIGRASRWPPGPPPGSRRPRWWWTGPAGYPSPRSPRGAPERTQSATRSWRRPWKHRLR